MNNHRVIVVGAANSGKTQLIKWMVSQPFEENIKSTVDIDFLALEINTNDPIILWDTAGKPSPNDQMYQIFYKNADLGLYCVNFKELLDNPDYAQHEIEQLSRFRTLNPTKKVILVGTKSDLLEGSLEEQNRRAKEILSTVPGVFCERIVTSAKNNNNKTQLVQSLKTYVYEATLLTARDLLPKASPLYTAVDNLYQCAKNLPPQKYQAIGKATSTLVHTLLDKNFENTSDKQTIIQQYTEECLLNLEGQHPHVMKAVLAVAALAFVTLLAATIGFALGFACGLWSGPGALVTGLIAGEAAAVSVTAVSSALGFGAGIFTFFRESKESATIKAIEHLATEANQFESSAYPIPL